jgi:sulfate adenylyltransferase
MAHPVRRAAPDDGPKTAMSELVPPHGGAALRPLLLAREHRHEAHSCAASLPRVELSSREFGDLMMLGAGGFTPLDGFMGYADWKNVCDDCRLENGTFWPIPITLSVDEATAAAIPQNTEIALVRPGSALPVALMKVVEKYTIDKNRECWSVYRTLDPAHPGVRAVLEQGEVNLAGPVIVLSEGRFPSKYPKLYFTPAQTRGMFQDRGWSTVAAFQTRNPMHRSHEHLVKIALEFCDGVLIHSLLGTLKPGDIPPEVSSRAISALIEGYFVKDTVIQAGYPLDMRYAGPREALLHAVFRQNYGCSHLIVGRDHAGVGDYYGAFDSQRIFDEIPEGSLAIKPLKMDWTFWCYACGGMSSARTCPHDDRDRLLVSGSKLRKALSEGAEVAPEFSRPEVLEILRQYYAGLKPDEKIKVVPTGHSGR